MGQAAVRPVRETIYRRALAWALAFAVNGALVALIVLVPRTAPVPDPLKVINLILVTASQPEPPVEPVETLPEPALTPAPERAEPVEARTVELRDDAVPADTDPDDEDMVEDTSAQAIAASLPDYEIIALPETAALTGTPFVIREIFCMTSSEATREAGHCPYEPHAEGLPLLRFATGARDDEALQAALGIGLTADEIRALFEGEGLPLADLSGEPTLADTSTRPTSSSDEMRDSLPPRHPDPAFGD